MTRVYVPTTLDRLARQYADGRIEPGDDVVVAEGDDEEREYAALMTAADASTELLDGAPDQPRRRVVVVAEVNDPAHPIPVKRVVAVHADPAVRAADADPDDDLAWYATQEIEGLLASR